MTPPLVSRAYRHLHRTALTDEGGSHTYAGLLTASEAFARRFLAGELDAVGDRIAFLVPPGFAYVAVQWGIWRAGAIAVPLPVSHPPAELARMLDDAEPSVVVAHPDLAPRVRQAALDRGVRFVRTDEVGWGKASPDASAAVLPDIDPGRPAMMIYTSGTTGRPKGAVTTHANISAQIEGLVEAWAWTEEDRILSVLPLHHVHGIVNVLGCALWCGARCDVLSRFDPVAVWRRFAAGGLTLFMAVPTIYARLITAWDAAGEADRAAFSRGAGELRLMVSGSAALPVTVLERWRDLTGHVLLERYGMTEIGMGLGNPLAGPRRPGHVGVPFPGVEVRLVGEDGMPVPEGTAGEIQVRGPSVFSEYWRHAEETRAAFADGWFRTGDVAVMEGGSYRILGRASVDIIKTGGEKVSALEVEEALREHPDVLDCAVVGVPDAEWGERVAAALVAEPGAHPGLEALQAWGRSRLAPHKLPRAVLVVDALPRNAMGKVTKPAVRELFEGGIS